MENPAWSGMDVLALACLTFLTPFVLILIFSFVAQRLVYKGTPWIDVVQKPPLALLAEFLGYAVVLVFMVVMAKGKSGHRFLDAISWNWPERSLWSLIGLGIVLLISLQFIGHFLPIPKDLPFDNFFKRPLDAYLTSIFAISVGPLMEEFFFRGFLYPVLARSLGVIAAVLLTALPFALIHALQLGFAWAPVLIIFIVGLVLTSVRAVKHSVGASFIVHCAYNSTLTILTFIGSDGFRHMERLSQ
jgi:membrane protease YdiL (CAAX protease family)